MARDKRRVSGAATNVRPYVERAVQDDELRENVKAAFQAAREVYDELIGGRGVTTVATRVATDKDIQDKLREAVDELRRRPTASRARRTTAAATRRCSSRASRSGSSSTRSRARQRASGSPTPSSAETTSRTRARPATARASAGLNRGLDPPTSALAGRSS